MGAALLLPVLVAYWEGRDLTRSPIGIISAGCLLMICGTAAVCVGWRHRRGSIMPSGVRATVTANVVLLVFFALELSDRVVRQEGRIFYWSTLLFLPAGLLFCGLLAARRWAWWTSRCIRAGRTVVPALPGRDPVCADAGRWWPGAVVWAAGHGWRHFGVRQYSGLRLSVAGPVGDTQVLRSAPNGGVAAEAAVAAKKGPHYGFSGVSCPPSGPCC